MRLLVALVALFGAAASLGAPGSPAAANGVTVVAKGSAPTWLQAHTHQGAECILTLRGITSWWFETSGSPRIHLLEAGAPFRTDAHPASAPPIQSTALKSYFKTLFPNQPRREGTFVIGAASTTLTQYQSLVIPRNTVARISNATSGTAEAMLAVTELLPKK